MKKFLSIFIVFAMMITLAPMNIFADVTNKSVFSDVNDTDYYAQAAETLRYLGILEGYPDGTFGAEKSITRAEMAAIVCRMINKSADAEKGRGETIFDDVSSDHWASGYINVALKEGIINGDGKGKFHPEDEVKHEEATKMLVCAWGYDKEVVLDSTDWSKGYLEVASKKGIFVGIKGTKGNPSTRGDIAVMTYNGLTKDIKAPIASLKAGTYTAARTTQLETLTDGAEIYYTTDGSTPTVNSTKYTKAILITKTCTLKAIAVKDGIFTSDVLSVNYTINPARGGSTKKPSVSKYTVSFDLNCEGVVDNPETQTVISGEMAIEPNVPERDGYAFVGWYVDSEYTNLFKFTQPVTKSYSLVGRWVDMNDSTDTDEDGITDSIEEYYGTDKLKKDTDDDGLMDLFEITITRTNPCAFDSDENGVIDAEEDFDEDSLNNISEQENNTNPYAIDSDLDDLNDFDEINVYNTNPNIIDTDEDGLGDGEEIELGLNPLVKKSDGETLDSERMFVQELSEENIAGELLSEENDAIPSLILTSTGNVNKNVTMTVTASNEFGDSRAIVGEAIDVFGENISEGTISFALQNDGVSLMSVDDTNDTFITNLICKYNADGSTEYLDTNYDLDTNTLSADINGEGTYFVMNVKNLFDELGLAMPTVADLSSLADPEPVSLMSIDEFDNENTQNQNSNSIGTDEECSLMSINELSGDINVVAASAETEKVTLLASSGAMAQADIVFIIDTTGSMGGEINNVKNNINDFVDVLKSKGISAGLALVDYQDITWDGYNSTRVHKNGSSNWFYNIDDYKSAISALRLGDGGDTPETAVDALETARLLDMRASAGKIFVLVTDADYKVDNRYEISSMAAEIELLKNVGVTCSVVCPSYEKSTYYDLYNGTDGIWADIYGDFNVELTALADKIGEEIVGDGYWIYLHGPVPIPTKLKEIPSEDGIADSDDDGLIDKYELVSTTPTKKMDLDELITIISKGAITNTDYGVVMMYEFKTNPADPDTDKDGIFDADDPEPQDYTITDRTLAIIEALSYENLADCKDDTIGYVIDKKGISFKGMTEENKYLIKDAVIVDSNVSGLGLSSEFADRGLGSLTIKIKRNKKNDALIYALRGTEFDDDLINDGMTDIVLGLGWDSAQSKIAYSEYVNLSKDKSVDYYITGHSLGGRLAQDVLYKVHKDGNAPKPVHSVTFNALGYNRLVYMSLKNKILEEYEDKLTNFYYIKDLVGEGLGCAALYNRAGKQVNLTPTKIDGTKYRDDPVGLYVRDLKYHGIKYFVNDYSLLPTSEHIGFDYWKD